MRFEAVAGAKLDANGAGEKFLAFALPYANDASGGHVSHEPFLPRCSSPFGAAHEPFIFSNWKIEIQERRQMLPTVC